MSRSIRLHDWSGGGIAAAYDQQQAEVQKKSLGVRYTHCINACRWLVLAFWLVALGCGIFIAPQFLDHTKDVFDPPSGSEAAIAKQKWDELYPSDSHQHTALILVHSVAGTNLLFDPVGLAFSESIDIQLRAHFNQSNPDLEYREQYRGVSGYFETLHSSAALAAVAYLGKDWATMFWTVKWDPADSKTNKKIGLHIQDVVDSLNTNPDVYSLGVTGSDFINYAIGQGTAKDMIDTDSIILPIAMAVLCCYLKSLRMMIIPLFCVGLSLATAFSAMVPLAMYAWHVASFAPSIMMSLTVAMSIDYNLFMLTRYREEILSGLHRKEIDAIAATVSHSGEVILASGLTLAITFASLIAFPMDFLSSIGLGSSITILSCLIVNLTFTPAMLLSFPRFFSDFRIPMIIQYILPSSYTEDVPTHRFGDAGLDDAFIPEVRGNLEEELLTEENAEDGIERSINGGSSRQLNYSLNSSEDISTSYSVRPAIGIIGEDGLPPAVRARRDMNPKLVSLRQRQKDSFWYKSAVVSTTTWISWILLLLVIGGCIPFLIACTTLGHTIDQGQLLPRGSEAVKTYDEVKDYLSPGILSKYDIMVIVDPSKFPAEAMLPAPILSETYFNYTDRFVNELLTRNLIGNTSIASIVYAAGIRISQSEAVVLSQPDTCPTDPLACLYQYVFKHSANAGLNSTCTLIEMTTSFPPLGDQAEPWLKLVRELMVEMQQISDNELNGAISLYITGGAVSAIDAVNRIYALFPYVLISTVAIVLVVVAIVFRSIFVPLRLVLTLAIPLAYVYGLAIMIFQQNKFDWLGNTIKNTHDIYWLDPIMAFSILVGLGLDYDIFLYSRIQEYRQLGYSTRASIRKGVYKTGAIITGAGIIMAIAFAGLIMSRELVLQIFGFMLCFAVMFDTFIIRTMLVPAILHLAGEANWYPTKMPTSIKGDLDQEGEDLIEAADSAPEAYSFR